MKEGGNGCLQCAKPREHQGVRYDLEGNRHSSLQCGDIVCGDVCIGAAKGTEGEGRIHS